MISRSGRGRGRSVIARALLLILAVLAAAVAWRFAPSRLEPRYEGRRLGLWLRGHPREYTPAVQALGTNALPYLLAELRIADPAWVRWAEEAFRRLDMGPPWEPARERRYHARIGLQILDTNAVPALLGAILARPMRLEEGDPGFEAAGTLHWLASPTAQSATGLALAEALRSPDPATRRNACLAVAQGGVPPATDPVRMAVLMADPEPAVRVSALRAATMLGPGDPVLLPAVLGRLGDEHAVVRWLAVETLRFAGSNAVQALPALRVAWTNEPSRPRGADRLDDVFDFVPSARRLQEAMDEAIRAIE